MQALNKIRQSIGKEGVEEETARAVNPEIKISIVRVKPQPRKHKVISYGYRKLVEGEVPEMYRFQYLPDPDMPEDLHPGVIPAGFSAGVPVDQDMVYFHTREGNTGPEYQVVYTQPDESGGETPAHSMVLEWTNDVDAIWVEALQQLEDNAGLSEDALSFLDADPLWLFGIADPATQRALEKTAVVPMLRCMGQRPCLEEWFAYLNADEQGDSNYKWVVESFAEVELPEPWTSFKGVGAVVCYLNNETNETTWKHPFYDYFAQLLNHCRRSTPEEHIKLRINRVLWSYEAESQTDVQSQMPLVSPKYVKVLADILSCDLVEQPFMVRTLKTFLKAFSQMYHDGELDTQEVNFCLDIVKNERAKYSVAKQLTLENDDGSNELAGNGQMYCIECVHTDGNVAHLYCPECGDCLCMTCFERLHAKGNRASHEPNHFILCVMCKVMPAKLQCTYTRGKYCTDCYYRKHAKTLPKFLDLKPLKIDYRRSAKLEREEKARAEGAPVDPPMTIVDPEAKDTFSKPAPLETPLGEKWHAFYDLRGVKYYYNFETQESMRRPQDDLVLYEAPEDASRTASRNEILQKLALSKEPRLMPAWEEGQEPDRKD
mmetsp:Transcript_28253/g.50987  ORF Transcript_28253/g.50987 Transcript_28253/m.50987 type:complete len:601 (-) Transcript_28253:160-1962(-)|eukprot:CAMPEP_0197659578 /NCGR_PEP_ID=MMETSP1338-20131121/48195_1 /TAXON_ID=43686 ORGANISM="Pelagodinium beii, Strain RCC1491" /NCGR_SAMPLE_ID=MMETSP1338 /ASSEMBLY_ACC=CAM_ASM_000754 /LENGTH=600 /DNA_ID=CAMNT_0043236567 /DNA_START=54 /DNA_END=1856 /DNA_ORIENTATION=+